MNREELKEELLVYLRGSMRNLKKLKEELRRDEGLRLKPYQCSAGKWTCGYGHNLEAHGFDKEEIEAMRRDGITLDLAEQWLYLDVEMAELQARIWLGNTGYFLLSDTRKRVVVNMAFNLGSRIFQFKHTRSLILAGEYDKAADAMLDSKWARQVGNRAKRLAQMMRDGTDETSTTTG